MAPTLPTFSVLGAEVPPDTSAVQVASIWFAEFSRYVQSNDVAGIVGLFIESGYWRDMLALTWDFRTFSGSTDIRKFLHDRLAPESMTCLRLSQTTLPILLTPYPDLAWVQACFEFETPVGIGSGVLRLVYVPGDVWKAYTVFTSLEELKGFEEKVGPLRESIPEQSPWLKKRREEAEFDDSNPTVLVVGAGQCGVSIAARLKYFDLPTVVVERNERVGDQWRQRYNTLRLHTPLWRDHLAYMPFPSCWPIYTPASEVADWLESYARHLKLNVWTSTTIKDPEWDSSMKQWTVTTVRTDGTERILKPRHIIWAMSTGPPNIPNFKGNADFNGTIIHSSKHSSARGAAGKRVVVIGSGVSAHDIAQDFVANGADVTMCQRGSTYVMSVKNAMPTIYKPLYWEGGPPTDVADQLSNSLPNEVSKLLQIRATAKIADLDRTTLNGLERAGFKLNSGIDGSGLFHLALMRAGGTYIDVGASQLIIDGKIKMKSDVGIASFTTEGLKFDDGSELAADIIILATGYLNLKLVIAQTFGHEMAMSLSDIWDLDADFESRGIWRGTGHEGFWVAMGNFPMARFFSKRLALQIKAVEEGLFGTRYSL